MDPRRISVGAHLLRLSTLGITVAFCIFLGLGIGLLLKKYLGWGDGAVIGGIILGVLAGFAEMVRELTLVRNDKGGF
jgi:F0F1-type ATP synthase assembly protein I